MYPLSFNKVLATKFKEKEIRPFSQRTVRVTPLWDSQYIQTVQSHCNGERKGAEAEEPVEGFPDTIQEYWDILSKTYILDCFPF